MYAIETNNLTKKYKNKTVVDKVNLFVPEGSIFGFVGENGAGKTTIMRLLTGLSEPSGGSYKLFDTSFICSLEHDICESNSTSVEANR